MQTCSCISLSGGQGKTTSIFFTALLLAQQGKKVLAIDSDPQANLTFYLNHEVQPNQPSLFEVLTGAVKTEDGIYSTVHQNLFLVPADRGLFKVSDFLSSSGTGAFILKLRLKSVVKLFDYVLIDVPAFSISALPHFSRSVRFCSHSSRSQCKRNEQLDRYA